MSFLFNLQLPFPSTDGEVTNQGSARVQPDVINKEGGTDDNKENIEEEGGGAEQGNCKVELSAGSQDANGKNTCRPKQRNGEDDNDKETITRTIDAPLLNVETQCFTVEEPRVHGQEGLKDSCVFNVAKKPEGISHPSSSLGKSGKNTEVSINFRSDHKDGTEKRKQGEELHMSVVDQLSEQTKNTNINDSIDLNIQSQHDILRQQDPTSLEKENERKKQPDMSPLAVPSVHFGPVPKRKELPAVPEHKKTRKKETTDKGLITATKERTEEEKIIIQPDDEHPGHDNNGNEDDDDGAISAEDLLCFSWQIAQGMVSRQPKQGTFIYLLSFAFYKSIHYIKTNKTLRMQKH